MKLRALKEASPISRYPLSQELFARAQRDKRAQSWPFGQEDIGHFAADLEVEYHGLDKKDFKRIIWEGLEGMRSNPNLVEDVFKDFHQVWADDYADEDAETQEEGRDEAWGELVDDFFVFMLNKKSRFPSK